MKEHLQQFTEEIGNSFLHLVHPALDIHPGGRAYLRHTQLINLPVKFGIINEVGCGRILHHLFIFQTVFLLAVFLHIKRLTLQHSRRTLNNRGHDRIYSAEHHSREEHDAETNHERTEQ